MSVHDLGTWLRQQRRARGWPVAEMARRIREAAKDSGDNTIPGNEAMCRNVRRWESGGGGVSERYQLHYCEALGLSPAQFGPGRPHETADALAPASAAARYPGDETVTRMEQLTVRLSAAAAECAEAAAALARALAVSCEPAALAREEEPWGCPAGRACGFLADGIQL
jgi:transcriptional regulator with XRE-family HTH domain